MKKFFRVGFSVTLAVAALFHCAAGASGGQNAALQTGKGLSIRKGITLNSNPTILSQSNATITTGKSAVVTSIGKKSSVVLNNAQNTSVGLGVIGKSTGVLSTAKKTSSIFDLGKASSILIGKSSQSVVQSDLNCKPICQPFSSNWCGWWNSCYSPWWSCNPCYNSWNCNTWWGSCYPTSCGWFGSWCGTVNVQPIVVAVPVAATPVVQGQGSFFSVGSRPTAVSDQLTEQTKRFLKIKNESGEKLQVFVQYLVRTEDGESVWVPGEAGSDRSLSFTVNADQELFVENNGKRVAAGVVRIWAVSEKGAFTEFRGKDLRLVTEQNQNGVYVYLANEIKTFTFAFPPVTATQTAAIDVSSKTASAGSNSK